MSHTGVDVSLFAVASYILAAFVRVGHVGLPILLSMGGFVWDF